MAGTAAKRKYCLNCGEDIGPYVDREPESCGEPDCNRELRDAVRYEMESRIEEVRRDYEF